MNSYELTLTTPSRWRVYRFHHLGTIWQECEDSNPGPAVLETAALPTELHSCVHQIIVHYIIIVQDNKEDQVYGLSNYYIRGIDKNPILPQLNKGDKVRRAP